MTSEKEFIKQTDRLHLTSSGAERIAKNLLLEKDRIVSWCRSKAEEENALIFRCGKNWYVRADGYLITVNANSFTIISARRDEQIDRIIRYEKMMNEAAGLLGSGRRTKKLSKLMSSLEAYYTSGRWKKDFEDDEAGFLPDTLSRGVLSEDGLYDLLESWNDLPD